jgi:SAM-dependent methyltransferase
MSRQDEGYAWQTGVWDRMSAIYPHEIDVRFVAVIGHCLRRAALEPGEAVLDLGTGTGAVAVLAAAAVGEQGSVTAIDLSPEMVAVARKAASDAGANNVEAREGRAEDSPAGDDQFDAVIASLSLMYVIDRAAAAQDIARVLRPGGRLVAAVWAGPDEADIVRFQQAVGTFAPPPPVPGVGPGALADPRPFLAQLEVAGITAEVSSEVVEFAFDDFEQAWDPLASVTTAGLDPERRREAKQAVQDAMWSDPSSRRVFRNRTQFIVGNLRQ